jgi:hypothetical protein
MQLFDPGGGCGRVRLIQEEGWARWLNPGGGRTCGCLIQEEGAGAVV